MLHGKQFAILSQPVDLDGYEHITLPDGSVLSWHRDLPMVISKDRERILLGHVWNAYEDGEDPAQALEQIPDEPSLLLEECTWCGRYVLILADKVYTDTTASLSVFYSDEGISSDISFLKPDDLHHARNRLQLADKTKWYPGPATAWEGISRLLPSQAYDRKKKTVLFRPTLSSRIPEGKTYEELKTMACEGFVSCAKQMHRHFQGDRIIVALTGGYDSRLSFAALSRLLPEYPFSAYTLEHDNMSEEDVENPPRLCEAVQVPYYYGKRDRAAGYSKERDRAYTEHLSDMVLEEDQRFYAYGQYDPLLAPGETGVLVRSNCFPLATVSLEQKRAVGDRVNLEDFCANYEISPRSPMAEAFFAYFQWTQAHPVPISDTNRFYWEQKLACWSAENDRGYDIYDHLIPVQLGNCRDLVTILLKMPEEERVGKKHQAEMTAQLCPRIADIPYHAEKSTATKGVESLGKAWRKMRKIGIVPTFQYYMHKIFGRN